MKTSALLFMIISESIIACTTIYFYIKTLKSKNTFNKDTDVEKNNLL